MEYNCDSCGSELEVKCGRIGEVDFCKCEECNIEYKRENKVNYDKYEYCEECEEKHNKVKEVGEFEVSGVVIGKGYEAGSIRCSCGEKISVHKFSTKEPDKNFTKKTVDCKCDRSFSISIEN
jgi:hypothetical protein